MGHTEKLRRRGARTCLSRLAQRCLVQALLVLSGDPRGHKDGFNEVHVPVSQAEVAPFACFCGHTLLILGGSMPGACFTGTRLWIPAQILVCAPLLHQPRSACPVPSVLGGRGKDPHSRSVEHY